MYVKELLANSRRCDRCDKPYKVDKNRREICRFHAKKAIRVRGKFNARASAVIGSIEQLVVLGERDWRHPCCNAKLGEIGCTALHFHVTQQLTAVSLCHFAEAPLPAGPSDPRSKRVYALDAEMVYTTQGMEIARLSMVDERGDVVIDVSNGGLGTWIGIRRELAPTVVCRSAGL